MSEESMSSQILTAFCKPLASLPGLVGVYHFTREGEGVKVLNIWTVIENTDVDLEMKIAAAQAEILTTFGTHPLHFMTIPHSILREHPATIPKEATFIRGDRLEALSKTYTEDPC